MVTKGELEIADLNRLYLEREQLGVQIMGFGYGQYLLGLLGERVFWLFGAHRGERFAGSEGTSSCHLRAMDMERVIPMPVSKKAQANKRNAQASTGPKTARGKAIASTNAKGMRAFREARQHRLSTIDAV
jgi:hypothetical protein